MTTETTGIAIAVNRREFATIVIPDSQILLNKIASDIEEARDIDVCSESMAEIAQDIIGRIATVKDELNSERLEATRSLREGQAWVNGGYSPTIDSLDTIITGVKEKLKGWSRVVAERKRQADAEAARVQREAAAKIEAQAKEQAEAAEKLAKDAQVAAASGDAGKAQELFEQAGQAMDVARETTAVAQQVATAPVRTNVASSGVKGERKVWKCRVVDKARALIVVANRPELFALVDFNDAQLTALAKTNQGNAPIPGFEFYEEEIIATRRK